jgi:hypothetical protein
MTISETHPEPEPQAREARPERKRPRLSPEEKQQREHAKIIRGALGGEFTGLNQRVAWVLNSYPEARDSDIKLQLRYWQHFENWGGGPIDPSELFERARLTSLARARAYIQNTHKLFVATPEIRKRRGKLSEEERQRSLEESPTYPLIAIYADETGKNADNLIVGSVWFLNAPDTLSLLTRVARWRAETGFQKEFHFKEVGPSDLPHYQAFVDLVVDTSASVGFKAIAMPRRGIGRQDEALEELFGFLLIHGAEHESETGRAPLPRTLQLWKDADEPGHDKLLLAKLRESVRQAGKLHHDGKLTADQFHTVASHELTLLQIADLFAGSLNRVLNASGTRQGPKDQLAQYVLAKVGMPGGPQNKGRIGDMAVLLQL